MRKLISPGRLLFLAVLAAAILIVFIVTLYQLQVVQGNKNYEESVNSRTTTETVIAARGNIMDRYGRLLVSNRNCNNLLIKDEELLMGDLDDNEANAVILQMCNIITDSGDAYNDELPITREPPWEFTSMSVWQSTLLRAWLNANGLEPDASAVEVMAMMRSRYGIDGNYDAHDMRIIAGVRYAVNVRYDIATADYVFAQDVSINTITALMEADLPGFEVQVSYIREYNTTFAPHILGYTGAMSAEQYETYEKKGYPMNATIGQAGVEAAFEELLHGTDGEAEITRTSDGVVTSTVYSKVPEPGNNIYLTIDIEMQSAAETALANYIETTNAERQDNNAMYIARGQRDKVRELISGGAMVAIDVHSGEPLCIASYPSYDMETYWNDYTSLAEDESRPLTNRALTGMYSPGSTFKPCVALAGLIEKRIAEDTTYVCTGIYDKYRDAGYAPSCTGVHGPIAVSEALTQSCNYFFFSLGDNLTITLLDKYASLLGLGEKTGIELYEETGRVASPEYKAQLWAGTRDASWFAADTLLTSIGQSITGVTPIQLARYCATIANRGHTYGNSILKSASSYDYSESIYEREPEVVNTIEAPDYVWDVVHAGMRGCVTHGTAVLEFFEFPYSVAAKTGTTETNSGTNDAFFICFAPYEDPQIAVAVALENGARGASLGSMAQAVLEYYFEFQQSTQRTERELVLLP